jgi:hypothetical protein
MTAHVVKIFIEANNLFDSLQWTSRDRCYDFLNIFGEKLSGKWRFLTQNTASLFKK